MLKLDLHGLRHEDARRAVISFVETNWNSNDEAQIITGHSTKMMDVVVNVLNEYRLMYKRGGVFDERGFITTWLE